MAREIRIPAEAYEGLQHLAEHADSLDTLAACVTKLGASLSLKDLFSSYATQAGLTYETARMIVRQLMTFHHLRHDLRTDAAGLFDIVTASLDKHAPQSWKKIHLAKWQSSRESLCKALDPGHPLSQIEKSVRLAYDYENFLQEVRILTDIRPVFTDDGRSLQRTMIRQTLVIEYSEGAKPREIHIALDEADIARLRAACDRADIKAAALSSDPNMLPWIKISLGENGE